MDVQYVSRRYCTFQTFKHRRRIRDADMIFIVTEVRSKRIERVSS